MPRGVRDARRQAKRLRKGSARGNRLQSLRVRSVAHRVRVSKMGSLSAAIWGHQGLGLSPKQLRGAPKPPRPERGRNLAASTLFSA